MRMCSVSSVALIFPPRYFSKRPEKGRRMIKSSEAKGAERTGETDQRMGQRDETKGQKNSFSFVGSCKRL